MPTTGSGSENTRFHSDYRQTSSTTTINSVSSARSNQTADCHIGSDLPNDRDYQAAAATDPSKNIILAKFLNSGSAGGSPYENLCSSCGYGVYEARGKLCNFCQYVLNGNGYGGCVDGVRGGVSVVGEYLEDNSNIYENICDKCSQLCGGGECLVCSKNTKVNREDNAERPKNGNKPTPLPLPPPSKKLKKRLLTSLLGSLKRVKSFNVPSTATGENVKSPPTRKLQIVHNVDGYDNVFRTNETFDLGRICELKQLTTSTSDHHIYGKLRKIDDHLHGPYGSIKQKSQSDDYLIGGTGCEPYFRCSSSLNSQSDSFALDTYCDSVGEWLTSLRCETHDYYSFGAPDTVLGNPKSIPGHFGDFGVSSHLLSPASVLDDHQWISADGGESQQVVVRLRSSADEGEPLDFEQQMVNEFKRSLMEKQETHGGGVSRSNHLRAKRQGIYLKLDGIESEQQQPTSNLVGDRNCLSPTAQPQFAAKLLTAGTEHSRRGAPHQLSKRCCIYEKDSEFVSDILQAFDSFLHRDSAADVVEESVDEVRDDSVSCDVAPSEQKCREIVSFDRAKEVKAEEEEEKLSVPVDIERIIHLVALSKGLNRVVVCYEFPLRVFLSGIAQSPRLSLQSLSRLSRLFRRFQVFLSTRAIDAQTSAVLIADNHSTHSTVGSLVSENIPAIDCIPEETNLTTTTTIITTTNTMTVPNGTSISHTSEEEEEPIYQPIWKFKTVGEVRENYITDEYYERACDSSSASIPGADIEDHDEWEPDDEFTFTTKLEANSKEPDTLSVNTTKSSSGSTITGYASSISTMTIASTSSSLTHHIFRNICIFYSLEEPKLRAVLYEYDRNRCSSYFAQQPQPSLKLSGWGAADSVPATATSADNLRPPCEYGSERGRLNKRSGGGGESGGRMFPDSVLAWKYMLLDVNYLEDEEDMIVSESQILKAQSIKEMDITPPSVGVLQRFKSVSSGNLLDVPAEEDKKSITERVRNKLQRGVFKLQTRSPKEGKKSRNLFRRNEATSLYLEEGMKPKYPIFKAPLELLEMNETMYPDVPRFVVDCIEYIEQKDCIQMDGLYRASGNKVAIDELKQKLTESYIYDPKLLVTDDIHTLTSLLKQFFRELGSPLIPQDTYQRLASTRNLMDPSAVESMKAAFQDMKNPNRATLKFLIKHLTTVAHYSGENRMPASNLAIVWGPCILSANQIEYDIARMNTLAKVLIENYDKIFGDNERLVS